MKIFKKLSVFLALILISLFAASCGNADSQLYKKYLDNPYNPIVGNVYKNPDNTAEEDTGSGESAGEESEETVPEIPTCTDE